MLLLPIRQLEGKMKLTELIDEYIKNGTPLCVNGLGEQSDNDSGQILGGGRIVGRGEDYITVELHEVEKKQENSTKEIIHIPLSQIESISEFPKKVGTLPTI